MTRKAIFDAVREAAPAGLFNDAGNVLALDNLLDSFGVPHDGSESPFDRALAMVLRHEGGYVNHPQDPGGRTNLGVTQATWEEWTGRKATEAEMRALTREKVKPLYRARYWDAVQGNELPPALALTVFDFAVNSGPGRASRYLQKVVGTTQDGKIGPATLAAVRRYVDQHGEAAAVKAYNDARRDFYRQLSTFATFGRGWLRRVDETEAEALALL